MPQMAPLSWLNLFISFIIMYLLMSMMNYYLFTYQNFSSSTSKKKISFNWKW